MFPTLWAVLPVLLEIQDVTRKHVKYLQEEYNICYTDKPKDYMLKLERQLVELQNHMYDSVTHNCDRVSGLYDNGSTPLQRQEGDQSVKVTTPENAIDDDAIDIRTLYPSSDINDMNDINQMTNYQSMKDIRDQIGKDMPLKTDINQPYIDNIDAYDRDRHLITASLNDRLDLGQNSLPGAQQVRAAVKHTDRISEFPEHLSRISLGQEIKNISQTIADGNVSFISLVDGIVNSRNSLDRTPVSVDQAESPVKYTNTQKQIEKTNEDTSDNDTDETITYEPDQLKKSNRKNINTARRKGRTVKICTMNIERKRLLKQRRENTLQKAKDQQRNTSSQLFKASHKTYKALKSEQKRKKNDNGSINDENMNITTIANNIDNFIIVTNNDVNTITNAKNADIEPMDIDNINTAEIENDKADMDNDKSKDTIMSDYNDDNSAMSNNNSPQTISGNNDAEDSNLGENSTEDTPSPLFYGRKKMTQLKSKPQNSADPSR